MRNHFILMKRDGFNNAGEMISASTGIKALCNYGKGPLWERTRCKDMINAGDDILLYAAGDGPDTKHIVGFAKVESIESWNRRHKREYPILLDGVPQKVINLKCQTLFAQPLPMRSVIEKMTFAPENIKKWGVCFMGGMRSIKTVDFDTLMKEVVKLQATGGAA